VPTENRKPERALSLRNLVVPVPDLGAPSDRTFYD
jgi:hypothetical protein